MVACTNNKKSETNEKADDGIVLDQITQNDYFRIQYPSFYEVYDQIDYPIFSTDELAAWCKAHPDSVPTNDMNEFYLVPKFDNPDGTDLIKQYDDTLDKLSREDNLISG